MNPFLNKFYGVKSKNDGPFLAFGEEWFKKYQPVLLLFLNFPVIKHWSRWILRIHRDCKYSDWICEISPSFYVIDLGEEDGQSRFGGDFRTHPKFSKRIYFAFRWWWWILHYADEFFRSIGIERELSFGFDTLTAYPSAGASSPCDGIANRSGVNQTFSAIIAGAGTTADYSSTTNYLIRIGASTTSNQFATNYRSFFNFATNIGSGMTISYGSVSFYYSSKSTGIGSPQTWLFDSYIASASSVAASDYSNFGWTLYSSYSMSSWVTGYNAFVLSGYGLINKTGITKICCYTDWDYYGSFGGTWVSSGTSTVTVYFSDYTGTTRDPKLYLVYAVPTSVKTWDGLVKASNKTIIGLAIASVKAVLGLS